MMETMKSAFVLAAAGAALLLAGPLSAQSMVPGFIANSTYWEGTPPRIQVTVTNSLAADRVTGVELVMPEGGFVSAPRLSTDTVTETRTVQSDYYGGGPSVGLGFGVGSGGWGHGYGGSGVGIGLGFPIGGGGGGTTTTETVTKEIRTEAELMVPNAQDYAINWSFYKIRINVTRPDGRIDTAVIKAPRP